MKPTPEEIKRIAIECGAICGVELKLFGPNELQVFFTRAYELGRKDQRESDAKICDKRANDCAAKADKADAEDDRVELKSLAWQFSVLAQSIRNNTGE